MAPKAQSQPLVPLVLLALVVIGALYFMGGGEQTQTLAPGSVAPAPGVTPASAPAGTPVNSGELELFLKDSNGNTGDTSTLILLDKSEWKGTEKATRYYIMKKLYDEGLTGLKGANGGAPKAITVSTGEWSEAQLVAHVGDQIVAYTYESQTTNVATDNVTTAKLLTLNDFYRETGKWVATTQDGASTWLLKSYATYNFRDGSDNIKTQYTYDDDGTADTNAVVTWYARSALKGQKCVDCSIWMEAPSNFSSKFKSLSVTDKYGHSKKFVTMSKAENIASTDPRSVAASVLTDSSDNITLGMVNTNWDWYYVGEIPEDFITEYTSADKNRLTFELTMDTYGNMNASINFTIVQNTGALGTTNGVFQVPMPFGVNLSAHPTSNSGFA